eukprot:19462-Heterococcus_DN1.PRE.2
MDSALRSAGFLPLPSFADVELEVVLEVDSPISPTSRTVPRLSISATADMVMAVGRTAVKSEPLRGGTSPLLLLAIHIGTCLAHSSSLYSNNMYRVACRPRQLVSECGGMHSSVGNAAFGQCSQMRTSHFRYIESSEEGLSGEGSAQRFSVY